MTEQEIQQKFDEMLMFILAGELRSANNTFTSTVQTAVNKKLDQAIGILEKGGTVSQIEEIRRLKYF